MPRYRLKALAFWDGALRAAGTEVEWGGKPGPNLEPLDEAPAAVSGPPVDGSKPSAGPAAPNPAEVEIPEGWLDLPRDEVHDLARRLGCHKGNYTRAVAWIEAELKRRSAPTEDGDAELPG